MTLLILSIALAILAAGWVIRPILAGRAAVLADALPGDVLDADAGRRAALASLREVEYDFAAGKLDQADYETLRSRLSHEALRAIEDADRASGSLAPSVTGHAIQHRCGFANPAGSRFCAGCGKRLE